MTMDLAWFWLYMTGMIATFIVALAVINVVRTRGIKAVIVQPDGHRLELTGYSGDATDKIVTALEQGGGTLLHTDYARPVCGMDDVGTDETGMTRRF